MRVPLEARESGLLGVVWTLNLHEQFTLIAESSLWLPI